MLKAGYLAVLLSFGLTATVLSDSSWARDDDDVDKNRAKHEHHEKQGDDDEYEHRGKHDDHKKNRHYRKGGARDHFIDDDHRVVRLYYGRNPHGLPPGLAKRRGKLPPGLSRGQVVTTEYHTHLLPLPLLPEAA